MGTVTPEMQHFLQACAILVDEMSPQDFSEQECSLLAYYSLELYLIRSSHGLGYDHQQRLNPSD